MRTEPVTRSEKKAATRARLLTAARDLFAERDYAQVTIGDITQRAGVAHGLLFHHFTNKQGIYRAVLDDVVRDMSEAFSAPRHAGIDETVRLALRSQLVYLMEHRGVALRLIVGHRSADPDISAVSDKGRAKALSQLASMLNLNASNATLQFVGRSLIAAFDEAAALWLNQQDPVPVDDLVDWLVCVGISALESATKLDETLDAAHAIAALRGLDDRLA